MAESPNQQVMPTDSNGRPIPVLNPVTANNTQQIGISGSSQQSAAITGNVIRVAVDTACNIEIGKNPSASLTTSLWMPANSVEYFAIPSGSKVAVIGTAGNIYITPVS
jgi:hypothetical protein